MDKRSGKISDSYIIFYSVLGWLAILFIVIALIKLDKESNSDSEPIKLEAVPLAVANNLSDSDLSLDTSYAADKLYRQWLLGETIVFTYDDPEGFFGTSLRFKYPQSMISAPGDKKRTIRKFGILDEDNSEFRCVINFQPMKIQSGTLEEKRAALSEASVRRNLEQLRPMFNNFQILDVSEGLFIASEPASYGEYYFENLKTDAADRAKTICRSYTFFYSGGVGSIQFFLDSQNLTKIELVNKFQSYKKLINRMANSMELY